MKIQVLKNPGLFQTLENFLGPANLDFFSVCSLDFFQVYGINLAFFSPWKKSRFAGPKIFLRFEADLNFSRPGFSEIKVQIKRSRDRGLSPVNKDHLKRKLA